MLQEGSPWQTAREVGSLSLLPFAPHFVSYSNVPNPSQQVLPDQFIQSNPIQSNPLDTVDHSILLESLHDLDFHGTVLVIFSSRLSENTFNVSVRERLAPWLSPFVGFPQESVPGPQLFSPYTLSMDLMDFNITCMLSNPVPHL